MNVVSRGFHRFDPSDVELLSAIGDQLAVAIDNAQLFEKSAHLAVVEERNWLAREIHDTLAQGLVALALQLELAITQLVEEGDTAKAKASLQKALALVRENLEEARRSVANLRGDR
jgi:two-component system, NarL family, sensor kinase